MGPQSLFFRFGTQIPAPKFLFGVFQRIGERIHPRVYPIATEATYVFPSHSVVLVGEVADSDLFGDIVHVLFGEAVDDIFLLVSP